LIRIEEQQNEQHKLLTKLYMKSQHEISSTSDSNLNITEACLSPEEFERTFSTFLNAYNNLSPEDKPARVRKLIRNTPSRDVDQLNELLDMFWAEGLQKKMRRENGQVSNIQGISSCDMEDCPHKKELERIDDFYRDFLNNSLASMP